MLANPRDDKLKNTKCCLGIIFVNALLSGFLMGCGSDAKKPHVVRTMEEKLDKQINTMMEDTGATAVTVAVVKDGIVRYEQAYGFKDEAKTIALKSDALMRTASIVKPVTAAAIQKLAATSLLSLSDHVYCTGSNAPCWLPADLLSEQTDDRVKDITIQHLIEHTGGFTSDSDPLGSEYVALEDCETYHCPATREDLVRYMMTQPLDFNPGEPGTLDSYSNYGYMVLGMIVELASKTTYENYVQTHIMAQLGIPASEFKAAKSRTIDHDPREPFYNFTRMWPSAYTKDKMAFLGEEGLVSENWVSVGQSISTARAMAIFASSYKIPHGEPLNDTNHGAHWGGLDGTATFLRQLPSGVTYAVFMNKDIPDASYTGYQQRLDEITNIIP